MKDDRAHVSDENDGNDGHASNEGKKEDTQKLPRLKQSNTSTLEKESADILPSDDTPSTGESIASEDGEDGDTIDAAIEQKPTETLADTSTETSETPESTETSETPVSGKDDMVPPPFVHAPEQKRAAMPRGRAILFVAFLFIIILSAVNLGGAQFVGAQGWASVLGGPISTNQNPLDTVKNILHHHTTPTPGVTPTRLTPAQYINLLVQNMTLDQKLGQMMLIQFVGPSYSSDLSTMISQYNVGAVLIFAANNNIQSKSQLTDVIRQMQKNSAIPLAVSIDQEGGTVDRLINLDGPRPSATSIGATNNPNNAYNEGVRDSQDLSSYGINLNLAPVVDVTNVYNSQMYLRTFGTNPTIVTRMAEAYLKGLQQSGKVLGTLKHFPGLGDVPDDPHVTVPHLNRSLSNLMNIDWAPYRAMIQQGNVYSIMVTHEIVEAVDSSIPSSLSYKLVTGILRNQFGFKGVIVTDSLTMEGILAYYTEAQAAVLAVQAGDDLLMGASTPSDVATMINGLKQAVNSGQISQQRIDDSVRRILTLKYQMGLLQIPNN